MTSTLRVGVNLTWLEPGRVGGSSEYLVRQLTGLAEEPAGVTPAVAATLYCTHSFVEEYPHLSAEFDTAVMPMRRDLRGARIAAEHSWLWHRSRHDDLVHHAGGTIPFVGNSVTVLTLHDVQYLSFPEYFSQLRLRYLQVMVPRSIRAATVTAVPTEYVRQRVLGEFDVDPERVVVVRHGVPTPHPPDDIESVLARYGITGPYVVYPAITHPHKRHRLLIEMMSEVPATHPLAEMQLVLVGGEGDAEAAVAAAIERSPASTRIVRTGRVPASDRDALIAGASVMAFPSEYEGFGAPLVEAMALGVPVVASDHPAIVEVVGDGGRIVDETDTTVWADTIASVMQDRQRWQAAGRVRSELFSIRQSGAELGAAYRLAAVLR